MCLSLKDGERLKIVYNGVSCNGLCERSPFVDIFDIFGLFVSKLGKQPADCLLTVGTISLLHAEPYANTLPSDGTGLVTLKTDLCRSILAERVIFTRTVHVFRVFYVPFRARIELF